MYVLYLPLLAAEAGIERALVPWILVMDQLIFAACDWAAGLWADRASRLVGRLGRMVVIGTAVSCVAFLVLPFAAPGNKWIFVALIVVWSATSSALRAPPLVLLGRHAPKPSHPFLASLLLFGMGVAGATSPYLTTLLRDVDARVPFVLASLSLLAVTFVLAWAERAMPRQAEKIAKVEKPEADLSTIVWFLLAVMLLGIGFQVHVSLNAAPMFLRFAEASSLENLMPLFWLGFSVVMVPASWLTKIWGGPLVMALGAVIGAASAFIIAAATGLDAVIAAQLVAGAGWGCVLMSAVTAALAFGHTGAEGKVTGAMFSALALMACARIVLVATQTVKDTDVAAFLPWAPTSAWLLAAIVLLCMLATGRVRTA